MPARRGSAVLKLLLPGVLIAGLGTAAWAFSCGWPRADYEVIVADGASLEPYIPDGKRACIVTDDKTLNLVPCDATRRFDSKWKRASVRP